ncbi:MAG: hypothetical protein ACLQUT_11370 [Thermoleophilia bacterium]
MIGPRTCAHCGALIDPPYTVRRRYCNATCRKDALRARRSSDVCEDAPGGVLDVSLAALIPPLESAPFEDQVVRAILEARGLAGAFRGLGIEAQPKLPWRCSGVDHALTAARDG